MMRFVEWAETARLQQISIAYFLDLEVVRLRSHGAKEVQRCKEEANCITGVPKS